MATPTHSTCCVVLVVEDRHDGQQGQQVRRRGRWCAFTGPTCNTVPPRWWAGLSGPPTAFWTKPAALTLHQHSINTPRAGYAANPSPYG
ncbi:MAG: hypothetical protein KKE86_14455 [Planctomycetes bacterium]|nr:hypothetical protein [Planctomycetota bacterium]